MTWTNTPYSSNVAGWGYDDDAKELTVRFNSGHEYTYTGVPPSVAADMSETSSVGSFVNRHIKGRYNVKE